MEPWKQDQLIQNNKKFDITMKWHNFMIYFGLWAGAEIVVVNAINVFTGAIYGGASAAQMVYIQFSGLKSIDVFYAASLLAFAAYEIYTRFALARYRKTGPKCFCLIYLIGTAISVIYSLLVTVFTGLWTIGAILPSCAVSIAFFFINKTYYKKRMFLFIND